MRGKLRAVFPVLSACLAVLVSLGLLERLAARRARAAVPIRIHVNGTRGKSTVTRLIAAALREAGIPAIAKVTGTAPRLIRADGSEVPVRRRAPANIREQAWLLREARRCGARAVVVECMAIRPDLQRVTEREMIHATVGVITNARLDHCEVMGRSVEDIARSLSNGIPRRAVLVIGDDRFAGIFGERCGRLGTRMVVAQESVADGGWRGARGEARVASIWLRDDIAIALAVTRELGIEHEVALTGMLKAAPDPGAVRSGTTTVRAREVAWIDATAANDPQSLDAISARLPAIALLTSAGATARPCRSDVIVYNHRADRPDRLRIFAHHSATFRNGASVLLTGDRPAVTLVVATRRSRLAGDVRFVSPCRLSYEIAKLVADGAIERVIFCGNTRGFSLPEQFTVHGQQSTVDSRQLTADR